MASAGLWKSIWKPSLQFVRYRRVNIQKPWPPHFTRAVVEGVCQPYFPKSKLRDPAVPAHEKCEVDVKYWKKEQIENPYVVLLGREMLNWFNHSKIIVFFHMNPMLSDEILDARLFLKSLQMRLKVSGREVMEKAVLGTKYEAVLALYNKSKTVVAFGPEPNIQPLLKGLKKMPKLVLLGGILDDRLMSRAELDYYGSLGDLTRQRAVLAGVLNLAAQSLHQKLNYHQSSLANDLRRYVDLKKE